MINYISKKSNQNIYIYVNLYLMDLNFKMDTNSSLYTWFYAHMFQISFKNFDLSLNAANCF